MTGVAILALAVLAAVGFGLHRRRTDGSFVGRGVSRSDRHETTAIETTWTTVAAALPDEQPGVRATLVQFSSAFCAPCRATRAVLADVVAHEDGVRHVEVDAEAHLALVRALDVRRTPTTLVLDAEGRELLRAAGAPHRSQVLAALRSAS